MITCHEYYLQWIGGGERRPEAEDTAICCLVEWPDAILRVVYECWKVDWVDEKPSVTVARPAVLWWYDLFGTRGYWSQETYLFTEHQFIPTYIQAFLGSLPGGKVGKIGYLQYGIMRVANEACGEADDLSACHLHRRMHCITAKL